MLTQTEKQYTTEDHEVWQLLYRRQLQVIPKVAYQHFAKGIEGLGFNDNEIPDRISTNTRLKKLTGWEIFGVPGLIENRDFFKMMFLKKFCATAWIRKVEQLDYLEEPDVFHDIFGHVPLLTDQIISDFLHSLATTAMKYGASDEVIECIARLYWYTIEFGLVKEKQKLKIYGAGILSSIAETDYCLSGKAVQIPFNLRQVLKTPYIKDDFQQQYFVLDSIEQLKEASAMLEETLKDVILNAL